MILVFLAALQSCETLHQYKGQWIVNKILQWAAECLHVFMAFAILSDSYLKNAEYCTEADLNSFRYFRRLQKRYYDDLGLPKSRLVATENGIQGSSPTAEQSESPIAEQSDDETVKVPVYCINLLRCNMQVESQILWQSWTVVKYAMPSELSSLQLSTCKACILNPMMIRSYNEALQQEYTQKRVSFCWD